MARLISEVHKLDLGKNWAKKINNKRKNKEDLDETKRKIKRVFTKLDEIISEFGKKISCKNKGLAGQCRSETKKTKPGEDELEKVITISTDDICNQFNLVSGFVSDKFGAKRMNIDLVRRNSDGKIKQMVELKISENKETPVAAMMQLITYFLIFCKTKNKCKQIYPADTTKTVRLIILAPKEYYENHYNTFEFCRESLIKIAKEAQDCINKNYRRNGRKCSISFQKIEKYDENKVKDFYKKIIGIRSVVQKWEKV